MSNNMLMDHHANNSMMGDHHMMNESMMTMNHSMMDHHDHNMMPGMDHANHTMDHAIDHMNHTMDHSMDHDNHHMMTGHGGQMMGEHGGGTHSMYFTFNFPGVIVLQEWTAVTNTEIIISLLGLCIMAIFLESIARLTKRASSKTLCYMAKKNLKTLTGNELSLNMTHSDYQKLPTKSDSIVNKEVTVGTSSGMTEAGVTSPESKRMLKDVDKKLEDREGTRSVTSSETSDVPLTLPQCLQYRVLLTVLHVAHVLLGYFLMLAVMTFNWWILVAVLAGSAMGYLLFGWGTHNRTLDLIASSTLPPKYMSKSSLNDMKENSEAIHQESCLNSPPHSENADGTLLVGGSVTTVKNDSHTSEREPYSSEQDILRTGNPQCDDERKVDIRVNLQGESILESEFTMRLDESKETVL